MVWDSTVFEANLRGLMSQLPVSDDTQVEDFQREYQQLSSEGSKEASAACQRYDGPRLAKEASGTTGAGVRSWYLQVGLGLGT